MATSIRTRISSWDKRYYTTVDGDMLPRVSTIIQVLSKPALVNWAANTERELCLEAAANLYEDVASTPKMSRMAYLTTLLGRLGKQKAHQKLVAQALDIGSQVHKKIEWELRRALDQKVGPEPALLDAALWAYMAYEDWANSVALKPVEIEQTVYHPQEGYAGTLDLIAEVSGERCLVDFKTGKAIYPEARMQTAAYREAFNAMGHGRLEKVVIVRLPKVQTDPKAEIAEVVDLDAHYAAFLHAKKLWEWQQKYDTYKPKKKAKQEA